MRSIIAFSLLFLTSVSLLAQTVDFKGVLEGYGSLYTGETSPFWLHTNTLGRVDEKTHLSSVFTMKANIALSDVSSFEIGAGVLAKDGFDDKIGLDQAYFSYLGRNIGVVVGKKHYPDLYQGLSASNETILHSQNAAAIPGIRFFIHDPVFFLGDHGLGFKFAFEEYLMDDDRYIESARLHHKSFRLVYRSLSNFQIALGADHYVQWGGISDEFGKLPSEFSDYLKAITGRASDDAVGGQEVNALGNQLGTYVINVNTKINDLDVEFIYNHIFEDGSGMKMGNFPDGRYGIYIEDNRDTFWGTPWVRAFMYEIYYTKNQSRDRQSSRRDGADNYFNNNLYRSGWTYQNQVIGTPFILLNDNRFRIGTNIIMVHHIGIKGEAFSNIPYRFLFSYRQNYGIKDSFYPQKRVIYSSLLELSLLENENKLKLQLGADIKSYENSVFGVGLKYSRDLF
ncbi:hypothetical protein C7S20_17325 [Christiangramia fulva]|uniref:Capsule assembly Wzi family protein n=1 Tax=Christiangramia fulva TaxID=2126553 RepID=A0A2R3Z9C1_9FLAO|nr:capsule assembly Wzi family protein [Christiangramia fulva]AVR46878.1 hypothetical protein C7S20_17325 [Christiangramia fulva]